MPIVGCPSIMFWTSRVIHVTVVVDSNYMFKKVNLDIQMYEFAWFIGYRGEESNITGASIMRFLAGLLGLPLLWGGFLGLIAGVLMLVAGGGDGAVPVIAISILALIISYPLGKYAHGDW